MAVSQKIQETGWFYHAPPKRSSNPEPVPVPPASQIPGLSDLPPDTEEHRTVLIKEFDSPYVRMAKMGGRPDLLRMHTPKPASANAKPYPKVDWFYQEDIKMEEDEKREREMDGALPEKQHEFLLPDYMVHPDNEDGQLPPQPRRGKHTQSQKWKPAPFAMDYNLPFQNEGHTGHHAVKPDVPNEKKVGYGVRKPKLDKHQPSSYDMPQRDQPIKPVGQLEEPRNVKPMTPSKEESKVSMAKLMEHGYIREWQDDRNRWYEKQQKVSDCFDDVTQQRQEKLEQESMELHQAAANTNQNARLNRTRSREGGDTNMAMLMQHSYGREWHDEHTRWSRKQKKASDRFDSVTAQRQEAQRQEAQRQEAQRQRQMIHEEEEQQQQRERWQQPEEVNYIKTECENNTDNTNTQRSQHPESRQSNRSACNESRQSRRSQGGESRQSNRSEHNESRQSRRSQGDESRQSNRTECNESRQSQRSETRQTDISETGRENMTPTRSRQDDVSPCDLNDSMRRVDISSQNAMGSPSGNRTKSGRTSEPNWSSTLE